MDYILQGSITPITVNFTTTDVATTDEFYFSLSDSYHSVCLEWEDSTVTKSTSGTTVSVTLPLTQRQTAKLKAGSYTLSGKVFRDDTSDTIKFMSPISITVKMRDDASYDFEQ